jgi:hypothetical protein
LSGIKVGKTLSKAEMRSVEGVPDLAPAVQRDAGQVDFPDPGGY